MERSEVGTAFRTLTPEQREAHKVLVDEAVRCALIRQRREICREVEQHVYLSWDSFIWEQLQDKVEQRYGKGLWDPKAKQNQAHRAADEVRKTILLDRWLDPNWYEHLDGR